MSSTSETISESAEGEANAANISHAATAADLAAMDKTKKCSMQYM